MIVAIIPCYNVEKYCRAVIEETLSYVSFLILVDDGSTDETGSILHNFQQKNQGKVYLIAFPKNRGKGVALLEGIQMALASISFDVLVTLDSDGQHLPSEIPRLVSLVAQGVDFAIGCREFSQMPFRSRFANRVISFLVYRIYPSAPSDTQSGFRAFSRKFVQKIGRQIKGCRYEVEFRCILLALRDGDRIGCCPIETIYFDKNRSSHFSQIRDSVQILKVLWNHWRSKIL